MFCDLDGVFQEEFYFSLPPRRELHVSWPAAAYVQDVITAILEEKLGKSFGGLSSNHMKTESRKMQYECRGGGVGGESGPREDDILPSSPPLHSFLTMRPLFTSRSSSLQTLRS